MEKSSFDPLRRELEVRAAQQRLSLPVWIPGSYLVREFARHLSGLEALRALQDVLLERGIRLDLSEVKGPVLDALRAAGWSRWFQGRLFLSHHQGVNDEQGMSA